MIGPGAAKSEYTFFLLRFCFFKIIPELEPFIAGNNRIYFIKPQYICIISLYGKRNSINSYFIKCKRHSS